MSYKEEIIKGSFWIGIAKYSGIIIQIVISAILARLISPAAFGTIAVAMVVLYFLGIFSDIGIGVAVVQFKNLTRHHLNSLFTLNLYIGIVLSIILYITSGYISSYYEDITLKSACQIMTLIIFFNSLNVVPSAMMRKEKRFRTIALSTLFFQVLGGTIATWGAFHDWGLYALLVSPIMSSVGVFLVNYYYYPVAFTTRLNSEVINMVSSYSAFQFAFSFINYFSRNLDKLIIGKYFSLTQLGYYDKSYHLMFLPVQNITFVVEPVLHPILSSLQDNKHELGKKNNKLALIISCISFPIGLVLYFCGGELIRIVYGGQWDPAIPTFRILALSLPLQMIQSTSGAIYQAAGKTNHMFYNGIINTFVTVLGFFIAALYGKTIEAMAWAWVLTLCFNFIDSYFILYKFTLKESVFGFYKTLIKQCINSIVVFIFVSLLIFVLPSINVFVDLIWKSLLILVLTFILAIMLRQYNFIYIIRNNHGIFRK